MVFDRNDADIASVDRNKRGCENRMHSSVVYDVRKVLHVIHSFTATEANRKILEFIFAFDFPFRFLRVETRRNLEILQSKRISISFHILFNCLLRSISFAVPQETSIQHRIPHREQQKSNLRPALKRKRRNFHRVLRADSSAPSLHIQIPQSQQRSERNSPSVHLPLRRVQNAQRSREASPLPPFVRIQLRILPERHFPL